jgi:hypothetical protein
MHEYYQAVPPGAMPLTAETGAGGANAFTATRVRSFFDRTSFGTSCMVTRPLQLDEFGLMP